MPLYEFKCRKCGLITTTLEYGVTPTCSLCSLPTDKVFSFHAKPMFVPHYNPTVGKFVSSQSEFNSELARLSDAATERTGITHNYVPIEMGDREAFNATDDGMDSYYRERSDNADSIIPESLTQ